MEEILTGGCEVPRHVFGLDVVVTGPRLRGADPDSHRRDSNRREEGCGKLHWESPLY
jgi:hypothetical protein